MSTAGSFPDLVIQFGDIRGITSLPDDQGEVEITIANQGEERVEGRFGVNLYASTFLSSGTTSKLWLPTGYR